VPSSLRKRFETSLAAAQARLVDPDALGRTLERLAADGEISEQEADSLRIALRSQLHGSRYVLGNLGAHLAIGAVFAFDLVPLPMGTIARVSWVAGNRILESARRNSERARVHSAGVFFIAAVPWLGYAAYLLPLRRQSTELAFVLANHAWLSRSGQSYEQFLAGSRPPVRRFGRWLVPLPGSRVESI
jgi:hypothetical protein